MMPSKTHPTHNKWFMCVFLLENTSPPHPPIYCETVEL
jgi:hypothetical protein